MHAQNAYRRSTCDFKYRPADRCTKTNAHALSVNSGATTNLTFDLNGNMTSDGKNSYEWDVENRIVKIIYTGINNYSTFTYDGYGRAVAIEESLSGAPYESNDFVWNGNGRSERRVTGGSLTRYFGQGQLTSSTAIFYQKDHLGSIREVTNNGGNVVAEYFYDSFGKSKTILENVSSDFKYGGYYSHHRSNLCLTRTRAYSSEFGEFMCRDFMGESEGINLFNYVFNNPINLYDPLGSQYWPAPGSGNGDSSSYNPGAVWPNASNGSFEPSPLLPVPIPAPVAPPGAPVLPPSMAGGGTGGQIRGPHGGEYFRAPRLPVQSTGRCCNDPPKGGDLDTCAKFCSKACLPSLFRFFSCMLKCLGSSPDGGGEGVSPPSPPDNIVPFRGPRRNAA